MTLRRPLYMILLGFVLVVIGFIAPLLMVIDVLETSFLLAFASHAASVSGLFLGIIGAAMYSSSSRR